MQRVAIYCRSGHEKSDDLIDFQTSRLLYLIRNKPGWRLTQMYGDYGADGCPSGTQPSLHKLMEDCKDGKLDIMVINSLSRLTKSVAEACQYIRELHDMGIRVICEKEGLDTAEASAMKILDLIEQFAAKEC